MLTIPQTITDSCIPVGKSLLKVNNKGLLISLECLYLLTSSIKELTWPFQRDENSPKVSEKNSYFLEKLL